MRTIYEVSNVNGTALLSSRAEAERVVKATPSDWGSAVGTARPSIREVKVFDTAEEWQGYVGARAWDLS